ncbi:DUF1127 domain-containing protein [uncultured Sulfitobacter sp.]|uniref:DUF1127 domain-containing protein n=1 Tax=uncultured Sulfitobacter sp. TaxID=191468 RepID=UPI002608F062|nr:DUF1127 domain-containing protein [uncultured Sulfitobacter sp.]
MTFYTDTTARAAAPRRIAALLDTLSHKMRQHKAYRSTYNELCGLSNRELADLGMTRGDIRRLSQEAADMAA